MLVITRRVLESMMIGNDVEITVLGLKGRQIRLGIQAPQEVQAHRKEIYLRRQQEKEQEINEN